MAFSNDVVGGITLVREAIRSANYVPGVSGWTINRDGSAEFATGTFRGPVVILDSSGAVLASIGATGNGAFQNISVTGDIIIGQTSLLTALGQSARGVVAQCNAFGTNILPFLPNSGVFQNMMWCQFYYDDTRQYRIMTTPFTYIADSSTASKDIFLKVLINGNQQIFTSDNVPNPSTNSGYGSYKIDFLYGPAVKNAPSGNATVLLQGASDGSFGTGLTHHQTNSVVQMWVEDIGSGGPTQNPVPTDVSFYSHSGAPSISGTYSNPGVEFHTKGMEFYTTVAATCKGIWCYNPDGSGTKPAQLWTSLTINNDGTVSGTIIANTSVTIPAASGWQFAAFTSAVTLTIGQRYFAIVYFADHLYAYNTTGTQFGSDNISFGTVQPSRANSTGRHQAAFAATYSTTVPNAFTVPAPITFPTIPSFPHVQNNAAFASKIGTNNPRTDGPFSLGIDFSVSDTVYITGITFYSVRTNISVGQCAIYDSALGTQVSGTLVNFSSAASVANGWNMKLFATPFIPTVGHTYRCVINYNSANFDCPNTSIFTGAYTENSITVTANPCYFASGSTLQFPTTHDTAGSWWNQSFLYNYTDPSHGEDNFVDVTNNVLVTPSATTGGIGNPPGTLTYTNTYNVSAHRSYDSNGNFIGAPDGNDNVYQGDQDNRNHGNEMFEVIIPGNTIRSDISGAVVTTCQLWAYCINSADASGSISVGVSNDTVLQNVLHDNSTGSFTANEVWGVPGWWYLDCLSSGLLAQLQSGGNALIGGQRGFGLHGTGFNGDSVHFYIVYSK